MNTYPLEAIKRLVHDELPKQLVTYEEFHTAIIDELKKEVDRLILNLPTLISTQESHERIGIFIQSLQKQLLLFLDQVADYISVEELKNIQDENEIFEPVDGYKTIYNCLEELLSFIMLHYDGYINVTYKIPITHFLEGRKSIESGLAIIKENLLIADIDKEFSMILITPFKDFLSKTVHSYTTSFEHMKYWEKFSHELVWLFIVNEVDGIVPKIMDFLFFLDFNSNNYFLYLTRSLTLELNEIPTIKQKLGRLHLLEKEFSQLNTKTGISYDPAEPALKIQLLDWIGKEINFLKNSENAEAAPDLPNELAKFLNFKIHVNLSINQVSYLLDVAYKHGIFINMVKADIHKFIRYFTSTKRKDTVTIGSLQKKQYKPLPGIVISVKKLLQDLVKITEEEEKEEEKE